MKRYRVWIDHCQGLEDETKAVDLISRSAFDAVSTFLSQPAALEDLKPFDFLNGIHVVVEADHIGRATYSVEFNDQKQVKAVFLT